jgi:hypothetical protein
MRLTEPLLAVDPWKSCTACLKDSRVMLQLNPNAMQPDCSNHRWSAKQCSHWRWLSRIGVGSRRKASYSDTIIPDFRAVASHRIRSDHYKLVPWRPYHRYWRTLPKWQDVRRKFKITTSHGTTPVNVYTMYRLRAEWTIKFNNLAVKLTDEILTASFAPCH